MGLSFLQANNSTADILGTSKTINNVNIGAEADRRYIILSGCLAETDAGGACNLNSCTINSVAASVLVGGVNQSDVNAWIVGALVPTGTSVTVAMTFSESVFSVRFGTYRLTGVDSLTPFDTATDTADPLSFLIDIPDKGAVLAAGIQLTGGTGMTMTGITEEFDTSFDTRRCGGGSATGLAAETNRAITIDGAGNGAGVAASWQIKQSLLLPPSYQPFLVR